MGWLSGDGDALCDPGANPAIEKYFHDCIYDTRDLVGFYCGLASLACWIVAQLPQLITNYRLQRADALSPFFLAEWLLGDTCNLVGALLKGDQPETVVLTAQYFICMDCVLLLQFIYYTGLSRRRERTYALQAARRRRHHHHHGQHHHGHHGNVQQRQQQEQQEPTGGSSGGGSGGGALGEIEENAAQVGSGGSGGGGSRKGKHGVRGKAVAGLATVAVAAVGAVALLQGPAAAAISGASHAPSLLNRSLSQSIAAVTELTAQNGAASLSADPRLAHSGGGDAGPPEWKETAGSTLAYISCLLYLTSRVSQIIKNATRHSAEGLASSMFICAVAANTFFGSSVLLRARTREETLSSLPWVLGSLGTVALDLVILAQTGLIGRRKKNSGAARSGGADEEEPLLAGHSSGT